MKEIEEGEQQPTHLIILNEFRILMLLEACSNNLQICVVSNNQKGIQILCKITKAWDKSMFAIKKMHKIRSSIFESIHYS